MTNPILTDADIDTSAIRGKPVAIIGYGNQGRAQALNLRDSGVDVTVGLRSGSASEAAARTDGFEPLPMTEAAARADIVILLVPDEVQPELWNETLSGAARKGATIGFAHGLAIHYGLIEPRADLDVILVAPKGPGKALRADYERGSGLISLVAVAQDASGTARATALAYAGALGCGRAGILETSFQQETEADLFNEQGVLWGVIPELIEAGFDTLVDAGFAPEIAYFECLTEVKLLADLIYERGIAGMRGAISNTAEFGAAEGSGRIVTAEARAEMKRILAEVQDGSFVRRLMADARAGYPALRASRARAAAHPVEAVAARMRALKSKR
ncbi:ketol-acid reductoisomerase [Novosphingopyxis sp.]|uniref:ketol-acid reductoisomerase n=1 Tax=Novosphingopyxis sp. TaxID=2709690 RepID=UPI003B5A50D9